MTAARHVKLFKNGRSQAVRIPREFELSGVDAHIWREGERLIIEAAPAKPLLELLSELSSIEDTFGAVDDPAPDTISF